MKDIPTWLEGYIQKDSFECIECKSSFNTGGIIGIGIKDAASKKNKTVLFIEYSCDKCKVRTLLELCEMGLIEFAILVLDDFEDTMDEEIREEKDKNSKKKSMGPKARKRRVSNSKITKEEVKKALEMLDESETWEDWLRKIGADIDSTEFDNE